MDQFFQQRARDLASDLESHQTDAAADLLRNEVAMHPGQVANLIATANAEVRQDAAMQRTYPNADQAYIKRDGDVVVRSVSDGSEVFAGQIRSTYGRQYYQEKACGASLLCRATTRYADGSDRPDSSGNNLNAATWSPSRLVGRNRYQKLARQFVSDSTN